MKRFALALLIIIIRTSTSYSCYKLSEYRIEGNVSNVCIDNFNKAIELVMDLDLDTKYDFMYITVENSGGLIITIKINICTCNETCKIYHSDISGLLNEVIHHEECGSKITLCVNYMDGNLLEDEYIFYCITNENTTEILGNYTEGVLRAVIFNPCEIKKIIIGDCLLLENTLENIDEETKNFFILSAQFIYWGHLFRVVFLVVIVLVFCLLPELRTVHGISLVSYLISTVCVTVFLMLQIKFPHELNIGSTGCYILGYFCFFFYSAKIFWMIVIGFDLWWYFCVQNSSRGKAENLRAMMKYSLIAWSVSMSTASVLSIIYKHQYGYDNNNRFCDHQEFTIFLEKLYFLALERLCGFLNLIFLISTSIKFHRTRKEIKVLNGIINQCNINERLDSFLLFLRLFCASNITQLVLWVMGLVMIRNKWQNAFPFYLLFTLYFASAVKIFCFIRFEKKYTK